MKSLVTFVSLILLSLSPTCFADCVLGAKDKTGFVVLDSHTIMLKGGYGPDIIIKTFASIYRSSEVSVLKDSFCSYDSAVLYIDGEVADANQVTKIDR